MYWVDGHQGGVLYATGPLSACCNATSADAAEVLVTEHLQLVRLMRRRIQTL